MSAKSVGFIGGGRIATVFLGGWSRAGALPGNVVVFDSDAEVSAKLKARYPDIEIAGLAEAAGQDIVLLAVHPPVVGSVVPLVGPALKADAVLVSLVPKFTAAKLAEMLGGFRRIVRMIPNAASLVGKGYNPTAFSDVLCGRDCRELGCLFAPLGACVEVPEAQLETYAVLTAQSLTYFWPQIDMLASLAEASGLSRDESLKGIEGMLVGAVAALRNSGLTPAEVQDLVPVRPLADEVNAFVGAARPKLAAVLAKLRA